MLITYLLYCFLSVLCFRIVSELDYFFTIMSRDIDLIKQYMQVFSILSETETMKHITTEAPKSAKAKS